MWVTILKNEFDLIDLQGHGQGHHRIAREKYFLTTFSQFFAINQGFPLKILRKKCVNKFYLDYTILSNLYLHTF